MNPVSLQRDKPSAYPAPQQGYPAGGAATPGMNAYPQQMPGQQMPGQQMPGQQMPGQQMPMGQMPPQGQYGQQMPGQQMPGQQMPGQQMPGQMPMGQMPPQGQYGQQMPPQGQYGQQMPPQGQYGQQMPGQMPLAGQPMQGQYGQVGMNPALSTPGQMGQPGMVGRISLIKGQNMSLTKAAPGLKHALIGLGWDVRQTPGAPFDLDSSCFMLNGQNQVANPQNFIFYNNKQSMDGSVLHHGDNLTGAGEGDDEQLSVDLLRVPPDVQRIVFVSSIYEAELRGQNFGMVQRAYIRVVDQDTQQEIVRFDLTEEACMWSCIMFGELYRYGTEWKFKALGNGLQGGLKAVGAQFGMQMA